MAGYFSKLGKQAFSGLIATCCLMVLAMAADVEMPLTRAARGAPIITASLNETHPYPMVLDTGAGLTTLSSKIVQEMKLERFNIPPIIVQLVDGPQQLEIYMLGNVTLAGMSAAAPIAVLLDEPFIDIPEASGIVGADVLSHFAVEINQLQGKLVIHARGTQPENPDTWGAVSAEQRLDGFLIAEMMIDRVRTRVFIDTGANVTIANTALAHKLGLTRGAEGVSEVDVGFKQGPALVKSVNGLKLADTTWNGVTVHSIESPLFAQLGAGDGPMLILGNNVLQNAHLFIDYANRQIFVKRRAS